MTATRPLRGSENVSPAYRTKQETSGWALHIANLDKSIVLKAGKATIGASRDNEIVIEDSFTSRKHCLVTVNEQGVWIDDLDSRNGTWINGARVTQHQYVQPFSRIIVGRTMLQLVVSMSDEGTDEIIGRHPLMQRVYRQIERFGAAGHPVLILGETGTGKELVARALHRCSSSRQGPFEVVNCGAIPRELAESELFGYMEGAFTGARRERRGAFERANSGTLFLDEIGELPLELQPKLLRVLEERIVTRLGDERRRQVVVQIIAATHRHLLAEVETGRFRLDLYHRLAVGIIHLPPLRDRLDDLGLLVRHFLAKRNEMPREIDEEAVALLKRYRWPGNVRELCNQLQRACSEGGTLLDKDSFYFLEGLPYLEKIDADIKLSYKQRAYREIKKELYQRVVQECGGNRSQAALVLQIPKSTFFDQCRRLGVD